MWAMILNRLNPWMVYLKIAAVVIYTLAVIWATHRIDAMAHAEEKAKAAEEIARLQDENQAAADNAGASVERALAEYKRKLRGIKHAPIDDRCLFTIERVQPLSAAINAGKAARERAGEVP